MTCITLCRCAYKNNTIIIMHIIMVVRMLLCIHDQICCTVCATVYLASRCMHLLHEMDSSLRIYVIISKYSPQHLMTNNV